MLLLPFNSLPLLFSGPTESSSARCQGHVSYSLMHLLAIPLSKAPLGLQIQSGKFHACWRVLCKVKHPNGPFIMHRARNMPAINTVGKPIFSPSGNQINPGGVVVSTVRLIIAGIFVSPATPGLIFKYVSESSGMLVFQRKKIQTNSFSGNSCSVHNGTSDTGNGPLVSRMSSEKIFLNCSCAGAGDE